MRTIVVGAGSAGAVIAARLAGHDDVVLLEAGPDYPEPASLPADLADGTRNAMTSHDWKLAYRATDHRFWSALTMAFPRGRVVGGSSAVNTCIALRGQPYDYDEWDLPGWSFADVLPYFKKLERDLDFDNAWHGQDGPLPIRRHPPGELAPYQATFVEACRELGFPACSDTNDPTQTGVGPHAMNKVDGKRISAARAWLTPSVRARIRIVPHALVRRVLFRGKRVRGVELERFGAVRALACDRVVLSAGAIMTPGVLLRSGIGPDREVRRLGVTPIADLPGVGCRLRDHPGLAIFFLPTDPRSVRRSDPLIQTVCRFTSEGSPCPDDMQIQPGSWLPLPEFIPGIPMAIVIGKPLGHGRLRYLSARADERPRIEMAFLADEADRARAREGLRWIGRIAATKAMRAFARPYYPSRRPFDADGAFRGPLEQITGSGYHPCGTAPMGRDADPWAVTDARGAVRGVSGLFVADASSMPTIPTSNTNVPTLMLGERMADLLREGT